jgi:hypothetical protein
MTGDPFHGLLEKAANYSSVLACGVYFGSQPLAVKSYSESFTEEQIKEVLRRLAEIALCLRVYQLGGSRFRWVFEHGQFHVARRPDGALAVLAMNQGPDCARAIEDLFGIFETVAGPLPEKPVLRLREVEGS